MESVPEEVIQYHFLTNLAADELITYCATTKKNAKICRDSAFWRLKVLSTPRRELQNEWFLFLAKKGETGLLSKLYNSITAEGIILDNRAICYAALYLRENDLSSSGCALLDSLTARAEEDFYLTSELKAAHLNSLSDFFEDVRSSMVKFRRLVIKSSISEQLPIYETRVPLQSQYLGEYQQDYLYKHTLHILSYLIEGIKVRINRGDSLRTFLYYIGGLTSAIIRNEGISRVKDIWRYINNTRNFNSQSPHYDMIIFWEVLSEATYEEAIEISNSKYDWVRGDAPPVDPEIFIELVKLENYDAHSSVLTEGYRALEPEEYIRYLNDLVKEQHITVDIMISTILSVIKTAQRGGYTYLPLIFQEELEKLKR